MRGANGVAVALAVAIFGYSCSASPAGWNKWRRPTDQRWQRLGGSHYISEAVLLLPEGGENSAQLSCFAPERKERFGILTTQRITLLTFSKIKGVANTRVILKYIFWGTFLRKFWVLPLHEYIR